MSKYTVPEGNAAPGGEAKEGSAGVAAAKNNAKGGKCCGIRCCHGPPPVGMSDIERNRLCTDCLCCVLFVVFVIIGIAIGIVGLTLGNPDTLLYGTDYYGNVCAQEISARQRVSWMMGAGWRKEHWRKQSLRQG